jgi:hypothetical protein
VWQFRYGLTADGSLFATVMAALRRSPDSGGVACVPWDVCRGSSPLSKALVLSLAGLHHFYFAKLAQAASCKYRTTISAENSDTLS